MKKTSKNAPIIFEEGDREPIVLWPEEPAVARAYDFAREEVLYEEAV